MGDAGLFGPESLTWRITREGVLLIGGGRALILQVAHPLVAAGVAQHSNYRHDPWGRLYRTLDLTTTIVFGDPEQADAAAERLWNVHGRVHGTSEEDGGRFPKGTPYDAHDPDLLLWVHATLVDTSILVYDRYVHPLSEAERARFFEEQKLLGEKYGVPRKHQPATYADFRAYFERMLEEEVAVTDALGDVVDATLNPALPRGTRTLARPVLEAARLATVDLLPPRLRAELGFGWGPGREGLVAASRRLVRTVLPLMPAVAREFPQARRASRRLKAA